MIFDVVYFLNDDEKMIKFCKDIFDLYDKHGINGHIERPNCKK
jgi:hypothetical protein